MIYFCVVKVIQRENVFLPFVKLLDKVILFVINDDGGTGAYAHCLSHLGWYIVLGQAFKGPGNKKQQQKTKSYPRVTKMHKVYQLC